MHARLLAHATTQYSEYLHRWQLSVAYLITDPFLRTSQSKIFDACFHDYSQKSPDRYIINYLIQYYYLYGVKNCCNENQLNPYCCCSSTAFQNQSFNRRIFYGQSCFFFKFIFFAHPCIACSLWFNLLGIIVFSYISAIPY